MPFIAKSSAPVVPVPAARHWTFDRAALGGLTSFVAPPGYLLTEGVFEALRRQGRPVIWVRLGPEDYDPAAFLDSLVAAVQRDHPEIPLSIVTAPGGWPARFGRLAAELAEATPAATALVVEHAHYLGDTGAALLSTLLGPLLDAEGACVVTSDEELPAGALPARAVRVTADDLSLDPMAAVELLRREAPRLSAGAARRAAVLCRGSAADLAAVCGAVATLGPALVKLAVDRATRVEDLLAGLAADWLRATGPEAHRALALALEVGYSHPMLSTAVLGGAARPPAGSWLQPLADGWSTVRTGWHDRLRVALSSTPLDPGTVHRAADYLLDRGAAERAAPLYLGLEDRACAAEAVAGRTGLGLLQLEALDPEPRQTRFQTATPVLTVHLLGQLKVQLDGVAVDDWSSGRGRALFKYLVSHRDPWPRREMLMEAFWPRSAPEAARNSLNVAIHGLRRAFRVAAGVPVVVLEDGAYRLDPDLRLWLDVDEFERHVEAGRRLEAAGDPLAAVAEYELAVALYQGDFLADDPCEEWPVLTREHLLLAYLDALDRLSGLYFGQHQYGSCMALCRLLLQRDPYREDAHRRLMRCFSRQNQPHLALRQYQACVQALRDDLGVELDPATVALQQQIRRRQPL
jgi:DNA-binding SARP family transcriptional activator